MRFSRESHNGVKTTVEVSDDMTLDEVLDEFQKFLLACGYVIEFDKVLTVVSMDE